MIGARRACLVGLALLSTSGCRQDLDIAVAADRGTVIFSVPASDPPCVDRVTVYPADDRGNPVWLVDADSQSRCLSRFRYGDTPPGFTRRGPVVPLVAGRAYVVSIARPGASGLASFQPLSR